MPLPLYVLHFLSRCQGASNSIAFLYTSLEVYKNAILGVSTNSLRIYTQPSFQAIAALLKIGRKSHRGKKSDIPIRIKALA
jgi:hypothetical protein